MGRAGFGLRRLGFGEANQSSVLSLRSSVSWFRGCVFRRAEFLKVANGNQKLETGNRKPENSWDGLNGTRDGSEEIPKLKQLFRV